MAGIEPPKFADTQIIRLDLFVDKDSAVVGVISGQQGMNKMVFNHSKIIKW